MHYGRQMTYVHVSPDLIGVGGRWHPAMGRHSLQAVPACLKCAIHSCGALVSSINCWIGEGSFKSILGKASMKKKRFLSGIARIT